MPETRSSTAEISPEFAGCIEAFTQKILSRNIAQRGSIDKSHVQDALELYDFARQYVSHKVHRQEDWNPLAQRIVKAFQKAFHGFVKSLKIGPESTIDTLISLHENFCDWEKHIQLLYIPLQRTSLFHEPLVQSVSLDLTKEFNNYLKNHIFENKEFLSGIGKYLEEKIGADFPTLPSVLRRAQSFCNKESIQLIKFPKAFTDEASEVAKNTIINIMRAVMRDNLKHTDNDYSSKCIQVLRLWHELSTCAEALLPVGVRNKLIQTMKEVVKETASNGNKFDIKRLWQYCLEESKWEGIDAILSDSCSFFYGTSSNVRKEIHAHIQEVLSAMLKKEKSETELHSTHALRLLDGISSVERSVLGSAQQPEQREAVNQFLQAAFQTLFSEKILENLYLQAMGSIFTCINQKCDPMKSIPFQLLRYHPNIDEFVERSFICSLYRLLHAPSAFKERVAHAELQYYTELSEVFQGSVPPQLNLMRRMALSYLRSESTDPEDGTANVSVRLVPMVQSLSGLLSKSLLNGQTKLPEEVIGETKATIDMQSSMPNRKFARINWADFFSTANIEIQDKNGVHEITLSARDTLIADIVSRKKGIALPSVAQELCITEPDLKESDLIQRMHEPDAFIVVNEEKALQRNPYFAYSSTFVENLYLRFVSMVSE